jgi:hypothetical protein
MAASRGALKVERVTVTLVPQGDVRGTLRVPSTYSSIQRMYHWRRAANLQYMIVPTRVSSKEVQVDFFINIAGLARAKVKELPKTLRGFVEEMLGTEWKGLRLGAIGKPSAALPPREAIVRGPIEDILGGNLEG